jgi:hypothetical protein
MKDSFYEELERVFDKLHKYYMKISVAKLVGKTFSNQQLGMRVNTNLVMGKPRNKALIAFSLFLVCKIYVSTAKLCFVYTPEDSTGARMPLPFLSVYYAEMVNGC